MSLYASYWRWQAQVASITAAQYTRIARYQTPFHYKLGYWSTQQLAFSRQTNDVAAADINVLILFTCLLQPFIKYLPL